MKRRFSGSDHEWAAKAANNVSHWFNRLDAMVLGPGLGQDPLNQHCATEILRAARDSNLPLVLDADALYLVTKGKTNHVTNFLYDFRYVFD